MTNNTIDIGKNANNLSGRRVGNLFVISPVERTRDRRIKWLCLCTCGKLTIKTGSTITSVKHSSCGCKIKETKSKASISHGYSHNDKTGTYNTWATMIARCTNPNSTSAKYYFERGITVCERWLSFESFLSDMGERPKGKSLDRIDNFAGYSKENCRWATRREQARNKRITLINFDIAKCIVKDRLSGMKVKDIAKKYGASEPHTKHIARGSRWPDAYEAALSEWVGIEPVSPESMEAKND